MNRINEIETRLSAIKAELETDGADIEALEKETNELIEERKGLLAEIETRNKVLNKIAEGKLGTVEKELGKMEERKVITTESAEYRDAFYAMLKGIETEEQRTVLSTPISVDGNGTADGAAIAIPKTLDTKIWDNIHTSHPILADISTVASGVVMEVTKHVAIAVRVQAKKDGAATAGAEENTFVKVQLVGKDYEKYVELTYAEAKMSQGALEDYLAQEIAAELGEALAKDVFAQIITDAGSGQEVTVGSDMFEDVKKALALATMGGKKTIYAPSSKYYEIVGAVKSGSPFNIGTTLGVEVKCDDAATVVTVVDPKAFVLNQISNVLIESTKDIKAHHVVIAGWMRAEGCLRYNKAASYFSA